MLNGRRKKVQKGPMTFMRKRGKGPTLFDNMRVFSVRRGGKEEILIVLTRERSAKGKVSHLSEKRKALKGGGGGWDQKFGSFSLSLLIGEGGGPSSASARRGEKQMQKKDALRSGEREGGKSCQILLFTEKEDLKEMQKIRSSRTKEGEKGVP